ncbi:unnamed protein product [Polarella glacialis]|uniref:Uncharacterized protein n=1 Tax=Polarella glacialis TaxID=89957 RepID=A0A813I4Q2_POLGL|nr:unnamed protein product [Polarella glacialis]
MPTHEEVIAQNPLEAPAPFWTNVYYAFNGLAAFLIVSSIVGCFVWCCLIAIVRVERWEDRKGRLEEPKASATRQAASEEPAGARRRRAESPGRSEPKKS